jgi:hypothetical protein
MKNKTLKQYINEKEKKCPGFKKCVAEELVLAKNEVDRFRKKMPTVATLNKILKGRQGVIIINRDGSLMVAKKAPGKLTKPTIETLKDLIYAMS